MMKRLLIPLLLVIALGVALFVWDMPRERRAAQQEVDGLRLTSLDPELVDTLRVVRGTDRLEVVRRGDDWWLAAPVHEPAEKRSVAGVLAALCRASGQRVVASAVDTTALDAFGLGGLRPPTAWIEMRGVGGQHVVYDLGRSNPSGEAIYLRVRGRDEVVLVSSGIGELGRTSYLALRIYELFDLATEEIDWIEVRNEEGEFAVRRNERGLWFTDEPDPRQVQRLAIHHLAYDLSHSRIRRFVEDGVDEAEFRAYGLGDPMLDLHFRAGDESHRLRVGNESEEPYQHFARRDTQSVVLIISGELVESSELRLDEILENNPVPDNYALLDSVRVVWPNGQSITAFPGYRGEWDLRPPPGWEGDPEHFLISASNLIRGIEGLSSELSVELDNEAQVDEYLTQARPRCELYWPDRTVIYEVGWRRGEDAHWIHVLGEPRVHRIPRDLYFRMRAALLNADLIDAED